MTSSRGLPYRMAPVAAVMAQPWQVRDFTSEEWVDLKGSLSGWEPARTMELQRVVTAAIDEVKMACRLSPDDVLLLTVCAWSREAGVRRCVFRSDAMKRKTRDLNITFALDGGDLAGDVELRTDIVIDGPIRSVDIFAPPVAGCCLWTETTVIEIEGSASQFPIESGDFAKMPWIPGQEAPWHIEFEEGCDPEIPFLRAVRLYINSAHPVMREYQRHPHLQAFLEYEVSLALLMAVVPTAQFLEGAEFFERRSLGGVVKKLATTTFPGWSLRELADEIRARPWRFQTLLRSCLELLHE